MDMGLPSSMKHITPIFRAKKEGFRKRGRWQMQTPPPEESGEEAMKGKAAAPRQASSVMSPKTPQPALTSQATSQGSDGANCHP